MHDSQRFPWRLECTQLISKGIDQAATTRGLKLPLFSALPSSQNGEKLEELE
jgi:hypothetical protein